MAPLEEIGRLARFGAMGPVEQVLVAIFVLSMAACLYIYFGYPVLIWAVSRLRPRPVRRAPIRPPVTLVIPAHDEEAVLASKLDNCLALDYPADRLQVIVVSDGSTDRTEEIARSYVEREEGPEIELIPIPPSGKAAALEAGVRRAEGEVVVLTDANAMLDREALVHLVEPFADPEVGGVCGNKRYRTGTGADATELGENLYWRWDTWQKRLESRVGSIFAADGALYALRRELFVPLEDPAQADDIAISTRIVLQGYRLLYEPRALTFEEPPEEGAAEMRRKIRVTNHSVRALWELGPALWTSGFYSVELLSHKFFRHLVSFLLLPLLVTNAALAVAGSGPFRILLVPHLTVYGLAGVGYLLRGTRAGRLRILSIPYYFTMVNLAAFLGVLSILRGERLARWTPRKGR